MKTMKKILVVDDSQIILKMIKDLLSGLYGVYPVNSGTDALKFLESHHPDLILLDVKMPEISGIELIKILKADQRLSDIPVIFLTVLNDTDNEALALDLGAVDYIHKPINGPVLMARVKLHLELEAYRRVLQDTVEKEREANQLKSSFLSNMSHEIRTPMNAIIGLTEIELHKELPKETLEVYKKINTSAMNLLQIVNDILDLSKIEANKLELFPDEFELEDLLNSALLVVSPRLEGKHVELIPDISLDLPRFMVGDKTRLWQILKNHLDNAAKFTRDGSIILTVAEDKTQSAAETIFVSFTVADTGIGMDEEQIRKAFLPYEQIDSKVQKKYTGTGLGLSISKRLCELMSGTMDIESKPGQGTVIRFTVPFSRSQNKETIKQGLGSLNGLNILVVGDNLLSIGIIKTLLKNCGANCVSSRNTEKALKVIFERRSKGPLFDMILLNDTAEGMNLLEKEKQSLDGMYKFLLTTTYESLSVRDGLKSGGFDGIIEKPFMPSQFIQKICTTAGYEKDVRKGQVKTYKKFKDARVLICEDNEINQDVICGMAEHFGIIPVVAGNGSQGMEILNKGEAFDLIFMDIHMPVMDGYEATRMIRSNPQFDSIPIISLTADAMSEVIDECLKQGMNDYLPKPIAMEDLYGKFLKWLPESKHII